MVPTFCRHNRFVQNCPICREPPPSPRRAPARRQDAPAPTRPGGRRGGVRIRQAARASDDGYRSPLAPGLKLRDDARRLAEEIVFATGRLQLLATAPPGLYAEVASEPDAEEALWLGFLIAYLGLLEGEDPFASVRAARTSWAGGAAPALDGVVGGPRGAYDPQRAPRTVAAYRAWAQRSGSQAAAYAGEAHWTPERRFERAFERLALPGLHLTDDPTTVAAKRVFGIGDPLLIDRRARELMDACEAPFDALDLALYNWSRRPGPHPGGGRLTLGARGQGPDQSVRARSLAALGA